MRPGQIAKAAERLMMNVRLAEKEGFRPLFSASSGQRGLATQGLLTALEQNATDAVSGLCHIPMPPIRRLVPNRLRGLRECRSCCQAYSINDD